MLILLGLTIGLAAGLTLRSRSDEALGLPAGKEIYDGELTYYLEGPTKLLGACGQMNGENDYIVSVSHIIFDAAGSSSATGGNSNNNPLCGQMVRATRWDAEVNAERSVDLTVVDRCTGCQPNDLDTSTGVFKHMASIAEGRVNVTWVWLTR
ncbi:hypothetical protein BAUCODRAFT_26917 [Baudoinia panamericana UAMH 10762]|uniref:RlpA-like protein double-psi beta-barrel domain-containing protein n=1 Tax=Baudoinia panamericana (strain UAMH 10762) TaxID=717646 RepID=M2N3U4_BAUPA|nr:uncharacterized protein BAUCODRAFT_26917 [Baudoinia panamericana UAMH 10762]EMC93689.1 hypothetical protein BAUCODRAFT_26917 [Baudoinia panamericana UAMH 10762]